MKKDFGRLPDGTMASLYTISCGKMRAEISDLGATLVRLYVPDSEGNLADVVLGFDRPEQYLASTTFMGAVVGRNANRVKNAAFVWDGKTYRLGENENGNNLHSGPDYFKDRLWQVVHQDDSSLRLRLYSPDCDQGFPGNATITVTYRLCPGGQLQMIYEGICNRDTVFNLTNHSYFNLAGHDKSQQAMMQELTLPARFFNAADGQSIPTGQLRPVNGTPMDFRTPKPIGRDIDKAYDALELQGGYDHNFEVFTDPCAILRDPVSGRTMAVSTDCPGIQFYAGNYLEGQRGKDGVCYPKRSGICLETQYYPDALNHPQWPQPITKAGERYRSVTRLIFT